jgi:ribonuclease P protein component
MTSPGRLTRRADFTAARKGKRVHAAAFTAQVFPRPPVETGPAVEGPRCGLTVTKKIGNSVVRSRIKRRLRAALRAAGAEPADAATDYVFIATRQALTLPFPRLLADVGTAFAARPARRRPPASSPSGA